MLSSVAGGVARRMNAQSSMRKRGTLGRLLPEDDELRNLRGTHRGGIHKMTLAEAPSEPTSVRPFRRTSFESEVVPMSTTTTFKVHHEAGEAPPTGPGAGGSHALPLSPDRDI